MHRLGIGVKLIAILAAASFAAGACGGGQSTSSSHQTLVVDKSFAFTTKDADPARGGVDFNADPLFHAMYDSLLTFKPGDVSAPVPLVAQSYTVSPDARTFTFKLRKDVQFSDGSKLTARDVAFSYNRLINIHDTPAFLLAGVTGVTAPDDYTVVITTSDPNPAIPYIVTNPALGIVNSSLLKAHGGSDQPGADKTDTAEAFLNKTSAGSGPYMLQSMSTSGQIVLKANPKYWGPNRPAFQNVVMRNVEPATQMIDIQKGTDEVALDLSPAQAARVKNSKLQVQELPSPNLIFLYANENPAISSITANDHFRQAVRYGLDYQALVTVAGAGAAQAPGVIPDGFLGALPASAAVKRDVSKARTELQLAGLTNPAVDLVYQSDASSNGLAMQTLAEKIKASLAEVGITVNLNGQESVVATANYRGGKNQMGLFTWVPDYPDPNDYLPFLPGQLVGKRAGWLAGADPSLEQLGAQAGAHADSKARGEMFQEIQRRLNQVSPIFPLIHPGQVVVASSNLTNASYNPIWYIDFAAIGTR